MAYRTPDPTGTVEGYLLALSRPCGACAAQPGDPCTSVNEGSLYFYPPGSGSRYMWYHKVRIQLPVPAEPRSG